MTPYLLLLSMLQVLDLGPPKKPHVSSDLSLAGIHRALPASALRKGKWTKLPSGNGAWRLTIRSPGAQGLRLHFRQFAVGQGKVTVSSGSPGAAQAAGTYTGAGQYGNGDFWSDIVFGDQILVEYRPADGAPSRSTPPFRIPEISHLQSR